MKKIVIDTNIFLNFYDTNIETHKVLKELQKYTTYLLLPNLVIEEFLRNKNRLLDNLIQLYKKPDEKPKSFHNSALIQSLSEYESLVKAKNNYFKQIDKIRSKLNEIRQNPNKDTLYLTVSEIFNSNDVEILEYDDEIISKAHQRSLLGNPPGSDQDKIGDEVIWETLLMKSKSDIIIVTRDKSYLNNIDLLKKEYNKEQSRHLIDITEKISDAIKLIGVEPPEEIIELENDQIDYIHERQERLMPSSITPISSIFGDLTKEDYNLYKSFFKYPTTFTSTAVVNGTEQRTEK